MSDVLHVITKDVSWRWLSSVCVQDKTFGLKNKKGAKQQKFIKNVTHQVKHGQQTARQAAQDGDKGGKKNDKKKELDELNELFKPVVAAQKVSKGNPNENPKWNKSVLILFLSLPIGFKHINQINILNHSFVRRCRPKVGAVCLLQAGPVHQRGQMQIQPWLVNGEEMWEEERLRGWARRRAGERSAKRIYAVKIFFIHRR